LSIDGTDVRIQRKQSDSYKAFFSYKFRKPGLRYLVALEIDSGNCALIFGPRLPGVYNETMMFREGIKDRLDPDERVVVDGGFKGEVAFISPEICQTDLEKEQHRNVRLRHETFNARIKRFKILSETYRGRDLNYHIVFFVVVAIIGRNEG